MVREAMEDKVFRWISTGFMLTFSIIALMPLVSTVAMSFSSRAAAEMNAVILWPVDFTLASWNYILRDVALWRSFLITVLSTIFTVVLSLFVTALMAYPLSKAYFKAGGILMTLVVFTMIFKAPTVPYFLTLKTMGLYNNPIVLVLPHIFSAYNLAIMRTSFKAFPGEIEEAAVIDGCGRAQVLFRIVMPSSKATLMTIGLFYGVVAWNQFQHPMMFITDTKYYPLQMRVRQLINSGEDILHNIFDINLSYNEATLSAATVVFSMLPIIAVYPWLQKYFVKGAMLGSVKG